MLLGCHVIKQETSLKVQVTTIGASQGKPPSCQIGAHRHCSNGDIMVLACHVI